MLWLVFDGTDSMAIRDELPTAERTALAEMLGMDKPSADPPAQSAPGRLDRGRPADATAPSRMDYLKALVEQKGNERAGATGREGSASRRSCSTGRKASARWSSPRGQAQRRRQAPGRQLTTNGKVTALGAALADLGRRHATANLGGVVVFSDFNQNAGPPAVEAARRLGVEVYTVGVGAATAVDVAVELQAPLKAKKDERSTVEVTLRQQGLDGQTAHVRVYAEPLGGLQGDRGARVDHRREGRAPWAAASKPSSSPTCPTKPGRFVLVAEVDPVPGEVVRENNRAEREITVRDDFLRLLFVEYEPTWEWRFIKEVFHRDKLVGMKGFRTFLRSSDPRVRQTNELFLPTMTPPRSEFFAYDVIFLGDMPAVGPEPAVLRDGRGVRGRLRRRAGGAGRPAVRARAIGRHAAGRAAAGEGRPGRAASTTASRSCCS